VDLSGNLLKVLPQDMTLPKCKVLILLENKLEIVPDILQIPVIERLDVRINNLKELPAWVSEAKSLKELSIYGNSDIFLSKTIWEFVAKIAPPVKEKNHTPTLFEVLNPDYKRQEAAKLERQEVCINWALERTLPEDLKKFGVDLREVITDEKRNELFEFMAPRINYIKSVVSETEKDLVGDYDLENHKRLVEDVLIEQKVLSS
jgi:Leucine-rich repeat (LRR) protein